MQNTSIDDIDYLNKTQKDHTEPNVQGNLEECEYFRTQRKQTLKFMALLKSTLGQMKVNLLMKWVFKL